VLFFLKKEMHQNIPIYSSAKSDSTSAAASIN
jgi:hypothetical protein